MFLRVVPIGNPDSEVLASVCAQLENLMKMKCRLLNKIAMPPQAFNQWRKQQNAEVIFQESRNIPEVKFIDKEIPTMIITDQDIYYKGLNYVFGVQDPETNCAIVSIARLQPEFYDEKPNEHLVTERLIKEAMHEIGHFKGLIHCPDRRCIMAYAPSVKDIDSKQKSFCEKCKVAMMTRGIEL